MSMSCLYLSHKKKVTYLQLGQSVLLKCTPVDLITRALIACLIAIFLILRLLRECSCVICGVLLFQLCVAVVVVVEVLLLFVLFLLTRGQ